MPTTPAPSDDSTAELSPLYIEHLYHAVALGKHAALKPARVPS